jgi:hypothetical protein
LLVVDDEDLAGVCFGHDFDAMGGDDCLCEAGFDEPVEFALQVRVHVYVWLVEDDGGVRWCFGDEPDGLEPHLEAVAHPCDFCSEVSVGDEHGVLGAVVIDGLDAESVPRAFCERFEVVEVLWASVDLVPEMS